MYGTGGDTGLITCRHILTNHIQSWKKETDQVCNSVVAKGNVEMAKAVRCFYLE